jgi:hypothetical protein
MQAGKAAAQCLLGKESSLLVNPKQMVPSWTETGARLLVARFINQYVSVGNLVLVFLPFDQYSIVYFGLKSHLLTSVCSLFEDGGTMFSFGETGKRCHAKSVLRVHDPLFYWKVLFSSLYLTGIKIHQKYFLNLGALLPFAGSDQSCEIHSAGCNRSRPWFGRCLY